MNHEPLYITPGQGIGPVLGCQNRTTTIMRSILVTAAIAVVAQASCPYMGAGSAAFSNPSPHNKRQESQPVPASTEEFLEQFNNNDNYTFMTSDTGTPVEDQGTLKAGDRGPSLLEDFVFRQKIMRFDHERVPGLSQNLYNTLTGRRSQNEQSTHEAPRPMATLRVTATGRI